MYRELKEIEFPKKVFGKNKAERYTKK